MINILGIKQQIEIWNEKLNSLASNFDSPWAGMAIFIILLVIAVLSINAFSSKK
ncbi:MAG: hypothetical protein Q4E69_06740 [Bacilli bacterium]|nr:hypothetical protein [Bacilli bacterium]